MSEAAVYLDHNGTTPVAPEVVEAMLPYLREHFGNPSSATPQGRKAKTAVEFAREQLAGLIGAAADEIVFTSGGTEANNLAIHGVAESAQTKTLVTSVVEHPATVQPVERLEKQGWDVHRLAVNSEGRINPEDIPASPVGLGTLILAQNEVGTVQPVTKFAAKVHAMGGVVHADAAQAVGKIPVNVAELGVDLLSVAGHKLYAPKGVGALYIRRGTELTPFLTGAGQERGVRPGTENVASIVGLGAAAQLAGTIMQVESARQQQLRESLWKDLKQAFPEVVRISPTQDCLPNTLMVAFPGVIGNDLLEKLHGVAASTGSACHAGVHTPANTLLEMGYSPEVALGALRLSLGRSTTLDHINRTVAALAAVD